MRNLSLVLFGFLAIACVSAIPPHHGMTVQQPFFAQQSPLFGGQFMQGQAMPYMASAQMPFGFAQQYNPFQMQGFQQTGFPSQGVYGFAQQYNPFQMQAPPLNQLYQSAVGGWQMAQQQPYAQFQQPWMFQQPGLSFATQNPFMYQQFGGANPYGNQFAGQWTGQTGQFGQFGNQFGGQFGNQFGGQFGNQFGGQFGNQFGNQFGGQFGTQNPMYNQWNTGGVNGANMNGLTGMQQNAFGAAGGVNNQNAANGK